MTPTRSLFGRSSLLATRLLNENQLRHFTTYLRLLADDLDFLARLDEMKRSGREYEQVRRALVEVRSAVEGMRAHLSLPLEHAPSLKRRVTAVAEVWAVRVEELRPRQLKGYGEVHPEAAQRLDPLIDRVRRLLGVLASAAARLPEA